MMLLKLPHGHKTQKQSKGAREEQIQAAYENVAKKTGRRYHCREIISTHQESLRRTGELILQKKG